MEDRADNKTRVASIKSSSRSSKKVWLIQLQFLLILSVLFLGAFGRPAPGPITVTSASTSVLITFTTSQVDAYYLASIPAPGGSNLLSLNWTASVSDLSNGQGSIQFSHENATWSNLALFGFASGLAQGKQTIDSTWAIPGTNYLRVSYWESGNLYLSEVLALKVAVNYTTTMLLIISPFVAVAVVGGIMYFVRKRNRQSTIVTQ